MATLETLVACCAYYHANDPNAAAPMDNYYVTSFTDYATYDDLHNYLEKGLSAS